MSDQNNLIPITIRTVVDVTDPDYFCNKSWTLSFNMNTKSWISFHTYIPNFYIGENNFFYSGLNGGCDIEAIAGEEVPFVPTTSTLLARELVKGGLTKLNEGANAVEIKYDEFSSLSWL